MLVSVRSWVATKTIPYLLCTFLLSHMVAVAVLLFIPCQINWFFHAFLFSTLLLLSLGRLTEHTVLSSFQSSVLWKCLSSCSGMNHLIQPSACPQILCGIDSYFSFLLRRSSLCQAQNEEWNTVHLYFPCLIELQPLQQLVSKGEGTIRHSI